MDDIYSSSQRLNSEDEYGDEYGRRTSGYRQKKKSHKKFIKRIVAVLLILIIIGAGWLFATVRKIVLSVNYEEQQPKYTGLADEDTLYSHEDVFNILLFGVDEDTSDYGRSDSMILLSVDDAHRKIKMTSFQRDTLVYVPDPDGGYQTKLTNAFSYGGVGLAVSTIEQNYSIKIDRYATVNFETFKSIVDVLGGVELELTDREILYINCQVQQNNQSDFLDAQAGKVLLNGTQALWHARNRGGDVINGVEFFEDTDWDRTQRQRNFMEAVFSKMRSASIFELASVAKNTAPYITTDMTKSELSSFITKSARYLKYEVKQTSAPADGCWVYETNFAGDVISVYDWDTATNELTSFIYEDLFY